MLGYRCRSCGIVYLENYDECGCGMPRLVKCEILNPPDLNDNSASDNGRRSISCRDISFDVEGRNKVDKERLKILLYNAIVMLQEKGFAKRPERVCLDLDMTMHEYKDIMEFGKEK